jgi:hypothetical protein
MATASCTSIAVGTSSSPVTTASCSSIDVATSSGFDRSVNGRRCLVNCVPRHFAVVIQSPRLWPVMRAIFLCVQVIIVTVNVFQRRCSATVLRIPFEFPSWEPDMSIFLARFSRNSSPLTRGPFEKFVNWRQCAAVMQREAVTVMPSCSCGGNVVVEWSSPL